MSRNFDKRIELLFEIYQQGLKDQLRSILEASWKDNQKARVLLPQRTYAFTKASKDKFSVQDFFLQGDA
jgi:polyphosphate kinase